MKQGGAGEAVSTVRWEITPSDSDASPKLQNKRFSFGFRLTDTNTSVLSVSMCMDIRMG